MPTHELSGGRCARARGEPTVALLRRIVRLALAASVGTAAFVLDISPADAQEATGPSAAASANRGFRLDLGPTLLLPMRDGGPYGGGLTVDARYGIPAGPLVLAPGGRLSGYLISSRGAVLAMPTFRITVPVGPLAPYVIGGVGGGWISNAPESGLALLGGGGLMVHVARVFAIGAEASYQTITGTELHTLTIGPAIVFGG